MKFYIIIILLYYLLRHAVRRKPRSVIVKLQPEIEKLLSITAVDKEQMKQNAYVSLFLIDAAKNVDYQDIAEKIIINNEAVLKKAIDIQDTKYAKYIQTGMNYLGKNYKKTSKKKEYYYPLPCEDLTKQCSIDEVLSQKPLFDRWLADIETQLILARYEKAIQQPYYDAYYLIGNLNFQTHLILLNLSKLRLAKAIFLIEDGEIAPALTILQQEVAFAKRMLQGNSYMIDALIAVRKLLTIYHVIAELMDKPQFAFHLNQPYLIDLLQPFSLEEQTNLLSTLIKNERNFALINLYLTSPTVFIMDTMKLAKWYISPNAELIKQAFHRCLPLNYNAEASINSYYKYFEDIFQLVNKTPQEFANVYKQNEFHYQAMPNIKKLYERYGDANLLGGILLEAPGIGGGMPFYIASIYDMHSYLSLVNVKLQIKQAAINKLQVEDWLAQQEDIINQFPLIEPIKWDPSKQCLTTEWIANDKYPLLGEKPTIHINFES